jgi:hypothetical protein
MNALAQVLDRALLLLIKALGYAAVVAVVGLWSLVLLALAVNLYKLIT